MASHFYSRTKSTSQPHDKRNRLRRIILETLERRELLAADSAGVIFAEGTSQAYMDSVIATYLQGTAADPGGEAGGINLQGSRWTNPTGGLSPNMGDPSTVTWSLVPDGTVDSANNSTTNLISFMDNIYGGGSGPVQQRPWFGIFQRAYDRWSEVSGLNFVYEANDDGAPMGGSNRGVTGVRGDVRIGGRAIDGNFNVLAFNYYPSNGGNSGFDGDMIIDTNDVFYFNSADGAGGENRGMSNTVMHEAGHGIGLGHVIPVDRTKLMEPTATLAFLGPQHDDILGAQQLYGDAFENNDGMAGAHDLGQVGNGVRSISNVSIDRSGDDDWYKFSIASAGRADFTLQPVGQQYQVGPQGGTAAGVDTLRNMDLSFELRANDGTTVLAQLNLAGVGLPETLADYDFTAGGTYFLRVIGTAAAAAEPQMYNMNIRMRGLTGGGTVSEPPRLLSVSPNVGEIFSFNRTNKLTSAPNELVFRFDGAQFLDTDALTGIRVKRSGFDGDLTDGDEVTLVPGWVGFGESERIVIARFASPLPDDLYSVEVFGVDIPAEGITAVRNVSGDALLPRVNGTDRDTILFDLELGNQIVAIVAQPTSRDPNTGRIIQARDKIEVYFNEGDRLHATDVATGDLAPNPTVVQPSFYRLFADRGTVTNTDDQLFLPTRVEYFASRNMARLTFAQNIDQLDPTFDTSFRLRIGTNETTPPAPVVVPQTTEPGSTFNVSGAANLGVLSAYSSLQISEQILNASAFPLDWPGAPDTPGTREVADDPSLGESHFLADNPDANTNLTVQFYNFNKLDAVGVDSTGQPVFSSITPAQEQRAREIFELFGSVLGISFVESADLGWTIATANIDGVGGAIGVAGGGTAIMDAAESWNDEFGANDEPSKFSWFTVAMHEIGHLLGLGHSTELPPGTVLGGFYSNVTLGGEPALLSGNPVEPIFPGATDRVNGRYLFRPDSRDIDMYRFEVAPGSAGEFTAQIVAERLANSSLLDSVLSLYREMPDGTRQAIAVNDDYFSEDSYIKLDLQPGVYYLGVSASGNTDFNPEIEDSGLGGTSEGAYELRTTFRPLEASSIVDTAGTALDGDSDGVAGGVFNYWFSAAAPNGEQAGQRRTLFVDKVTGTTAGDGSRLTPFRTISAAFAAAQPGDVVRIVPNGGVDGNVATQEDNFAYEVGTGGLGNQPLADGPTMNVPKGVTVMVDAGVLFKMGRSVIGIGSSTSSGDRSRAAFQVLGTPEQQVFFTSYTNENLGVDTDPLKTSPGAGDWGGIIFRNALDRAEGRFDAELQGRFVNYVSHANMTYGGGQVPVDGQNRVITPLHMVTARPTLINNSISNSAFAAVSADPNSFQETTFIQPRFQSDALFTPDYERVGPEIRGNRLNGNSLNGLFIRVETSAGQTTAAQTVAGRWDDTDIVHVVADTLTLQGTPGGPIFEDSQPQLAVVSLTSGGSVAGGQLIAGNSYSYRMTFVDANGNQGVASTATQTFTVPTGANAIRLGNLPAAGGAFVARKIFRSDDGGVTYRLVAELDRSSTVYVDSAAQRGSVLNTATTLNRARLDANLVVDPGMIVKLQGGRIVAGVSAQLVAEGRDGLPVIFTSRQDDRFGAGTTFDTNGDGSNSAPQPGDWGGLYFSQTGSGSLDNALITFGGGVTGAAGTFAGFNAVEIHQSDVRIANSTLENNADGTGGPATSNREGFGFNEGAAIFVRGSEPIIVDNIIRNNGQAAISIDPQSMSGNSVKDKGRITGLADRRSAITENKGPLLRGNALGGNGVNAMVIRGATLTTESVWDDTDIVHAVFDEILIPDLYVFGGLRMQSSPSETLVVKFGPGAGITSNGRPLDIDDRIGGTLQVVGTPGFPVILTSLRDDTVGAGFDPEGRAQTDTNNDSNSTVPSAGNWRSLRIDQYSNDRNVAVATELEPAQSTGAGVNGTPSSAQRLGLLAMGEKSSDDNLRLGYTVVGAINNIDDVDVYSFTGTAGTQVWFDIDRTNISLDAVVELVDSDGNIIAQSDNSFDESRGALSLYSNPAAIETTQVNSMQSNPFSPRNGGSGPASLANTFADFYGTNPLDPGMRLVLPGATGSINTYFVRVRSSNIDSRDPAAVRADLQDPAKLSHGKTEGQYQLQIRLRETDEFAGSSISFADIRYATNGIEVIGGPAHSPLVGEAVELTTNNNILANALDLGNLLNTERAVLSVAGDLNEPLDVDWYRFVINQDSLQSSGLVQHLATVIDVDYADGLGRANTSLWLYYDDQNGLGSGTNTGIRLVNFGTDSSIADDFGAPLNGSDTDDLSRGTAGLLDAFIGSSQLPAGTYYLAITSNEQVSSYVNQFFSAAGGANPLVRVEPINSVTRIIEDRFGGSVTTAGGPLQVGFSSGAANQVPFSLADIPLFITQRAPGNDQSEIITVSAMTGAQTSLISRFPYVEDAAIRGDGTVHGSRSPQTGIVNDGNSGGILAIDIAGNGATTAVTTGSGITTYELNRTVNPPAAAVALTPGAGANARQGVGMEFRGLTYPQIGNTQFLFGVASRANGATTYDTLGGGIDARNYIYKLDPTSLAAISSPQNDRVDPGFLNGAGTQIRERGYIDTSRDVSQNATYQTIIMSAASPTNGPSLLDGDRVTVNTPTGNVVFEWTASQLSGTLLANTSPQSQVNNFPPAPTNFFRDGETFTLNSFSDSRTFEIDTGRVMVNNYSTLTAPATWDGSTFTVTDLNGSTVTFEFDAAGGVVAGRTPVPYDAANSTQFQVSLAIINAINNAVAPAGAPAWSARAALLPGTNRISITGDTGVALGTFTLANTGPAPQPTVDTWTPTTSPNPLTLSTLTSVGGLGGGQTYDGATFTVTDLDGDAFTFEFDTNNAVTAGNVAVSITDTSTTNFIALAVQSAINFPTGVNPAPANWSARSDPPGGGNVLRLLGESQIVLSPSTATVVNPLLGSAEYGLVDAASGNDDIFIEEYFTNLPNTQLLPTPSTPGAMPALIAAINAANMGITASNIGTRLILNGGTTADFSNILAIATNVSGGGGDVQLPFAFNASANVLNNTLLNAIQAFVPEAQFMNDGRIWLPSYASFNQLGTNDRLDNPARNAELSVPLYGYVNGLAFAGNTMFGVSQNGDLYRVGGTAFQMNGTNNTGDFIETIYNTATGNRVNFTSLASGPRNVENGAFANTLFGIDAGGVLYAFDTQGRPAPIFEDGAWFVQTDATNPSGLAFSNLDVNLWHTTNNRNTDDGHGVNIAFDGSRRTQQQGGNSLYFGFQNPTAAQRQVGTWTGVNDPGGNFPGYDATIYDSYDFPGGTRGSIVSNVMDLSSYGPADKPMLYFNYYLATEDANASNVTDMNFMKDSLRVFIAGDDGVWQLLATNNSDYDAARNSVFGAQFDEHDYPFRDDAANALSRQISELYDAGVNGAPDSWRQVRADLSRFAGEQNVRIRFDFSTSGSMDVGQTGGVELVALPGSRLREGQTFQIDATTFEFDLGLVLQIPSGARLTAGQTFEVDGVTYTFSTANNFGTNVFFNPTETAATIAARISTKLQPRGLNTSIDPQAPSRVVVMNAVNPTPAIDPTLPPNFVTDTPGVAIGNQGVLINNAMTAIQVRDAIRVSLARAFNAPGQQNNTAVFRVNQQSIFLYNHAITNRGPLGASTTLQGDVFGEPISGPINIVGRGAQRGQNNRFEGVYIDDIIVGFAERGEMVTYQNNDTVSDTTFVLNPRHEPAPGYAEIETGTYQIEIRRGATYGIGGSTFPSLGLFTSFDTNDRLAQQVSLIAPNGAQLTDRQIFTLSDGVDTVRYEYDDTSITSGPFVGVAQGNIRIPFSSVDSADTIARRIRDAINGPQSRAVLDIVAGMSDGTVTGTTNIGKVSTSRVINIHGNVSVNNQGSNAFNGTRATTITRPTQPGYVLHGIDSFKTSESGDSNRVREQGQILVHSNIIRDASSYGIVVDAGARVNNSLIPLAGALPHPGSVRNLVQFSQEDLIPGPVLINNLIYANAIGGILFSGDSRSAATTEAPRPFGRIVNNTIVGLNGGGVGINVTDNASPTLLNNIVASLSTGVSIDNTSNTTVVGATTFQNNGVNGTLGIDAQVLSPTEPLFVNAAERNYYPAAGSRIIDSSIDTQNDRQSMTTVRDPLGIAVSPILAPDADITGQLRVDDPNISNPNGTGGNPFKDRGAFDRADFFGPVALIQKPIDNDPDNLDIDRFNTFIQLQSGTLDSFSILLVEPEGTGPDSSTVTQDSVAISQNGRLLKPGVDYIFGYSPASRLIRITPLAGIWRSDSVYEITLNNQDGIRIASGDGASFGDGRSFTVDAGGNTLTFEYDSDGFVSAGAIRIPFQQSYTEYQMASQLVAALNGAGAGLFAYLLGGGTLMLHNADAVNGIATTSVGAITDVAGNPLQANRISSLTQFTIVMPEVQLDYGDAPGANSTTLQSQNGSRHAILPVDAPLLALGRIADGDANGQPSASARADDNESALQATNMPGLSVGTAGPAVLQVPTPSPTLDGQQFIVQDIAGNSVTFELDTNSTPSSGSVVPVDLSAAATAADVAQAIQNAVNAAVQRGAINDLTAIASGATVDLGGSRSHRVDVSAAPSLQRLAIGDFDLLLPSSGFADGQFIELRDGNGRVQRYELNDVAGGASPIVVSPYIAVNVDLSTATPGDVAQAFADAINHQITINAILFAPVVANGRTISILGDDDDGVTFGGLFNSQSAAVPVTVTSTGTGILDVWFDWNGDGDFTDAGERIATNLPVQPGENIIMVQTPTTAVVGFTTARFRLSATGNLLLGGLAAGGEVEDHLIEIVAGNPPVAVNDGYSVDEDTTLTVVAPGILSNDSDIDGSPIRIVDADNSLPGLQPARQPVNGTVVLNADGSFTYTPFLDFFGTDTFVYNVQDERLSSAVPATVTITVNPINDRPTAVDDVVNLLEDEGFVRPFTDFTANDFKGIEGRRSQTNELGQSLDIVNAVMIHPVGRGGSVSLANGEMTFVAPPDYNNDIDGPLLIAVTIRDSGTAGADAMPLEHTGTLTINLAAVNDAPILSIATPEITVLEDNESLTGVEPTVIAGFASTVAQGPATATDELANQTLTLSVLSVSDPSLFDVQPQILLNGDLTFSTAADQHGQAIVVIRIMDDGPDSTTGNGDENTAQPDHTITINITPVNDPPEFTIPSTVNSREDQGLVVVPGFATDLRPGPATAIDEATQQFTVTVQAVDPSAFSVQPAIAADGTLTFRTAADVNSNNANLAVRVFLTDNGVAGPLPDNNTSATKTFTIITEAINDSPIFGLGSSTVTVIEDVEQFLGTAQTTVLGFATNPLPGPATATDELSQTLTFDVVSVSAPELFSVQPAIAAATGDLTFKTAANKNGKSIVIVRLRDDGVASPTPNSNVSSLHTFTISITPINDAPEFTLPGLLAVDEDAGLVSRSGFATNVRRGPIGSDDENSQLINFEVVANSPTAFAVQPSIGVDGTLTFQTAANANSLNADLSFTVVLADNGLSTPPPNQNRSALKTFTLTVNPVNDAPTTDAFTIVGVEDNPVTIDSDAVLVGDTPGPTADEQGQSLRITQVGRTSAKGGSITPVFGDASDPTKITSMTYVPPANLAGSDTFQYVVTDNGLPQQSGTGTITITLNGVNDPPQFTRGADAFVSEDAGSVSVANWATNILAGPPSAIDEHASQTVTFEAVALNPTLFAIQPAVSSDGTLTYTPAKDANGTSQVTVRAVDNGPTGAPHNNASAFQTFTVTVNPVNDAPIFTAGGNVVVDEDSGAFSASWATGIAAAAGLLDNPQTATDEAGQGLDFNLAADRPALFSVQPSVSSTGELTFTPQANAFGEAVVTVTLVDRGPSGAPNVNTSTQRTFTISITASNDAPVAVADSYNTTEDSLLSIAAPGVLANDTDVDLPLDSLSAVAGTFVSDSGATVVLNADGSFTYDAKSVAVFQQLQTGQSVFDRFVYKAQDASGAQSQNATVTIRVDGDNDAPVAVNDGFSVGVGQTVDLAVLANDTDVDSTIDKQSIAVTANPAFGSVQVNNLGFVRYTPDAGFRGVDTFRYTVRDSQGKISNEAIVTVTVNSAPVAGNDNAITFKNEPVVITVTNNDTDVDGTIDTSSVVIAQQPTSGTVEVLTGGRVRFTPATGFSGQTQFSYSVKDNVGTSSNVATVTVRVQNSKWQNPQAPLDVNGDGTVSPIDALILVNYINAGKESFLPNTTIVAPPYLDPTGDEFVTPADVLRIINFLNASSAGGGEGEGQVDFENADDLSSTAYVMTVTPLQVIETVGPQIVQEIQHAFDAARQAAMEATGGITLEASLGAPAGMDESEDSEDDMLEMLSCSRDEVHHSPAAEAVDLFFSGVGPKRKS